MGEIAPPPKLGPLPAQLHPRGPRPGLPKEAERPAFAGLCVDRDRGFEPATARAPSRSDPGVPGALPRSRAVLSCYALCAVALSLFPGLIPVDGCPGSRTNSTVAGGGAARRLAALGTRTSASPRRSSADMQPRECCFSSDAAANAMTCSASRRSSLQAEAQAALA